MTASADGTYSFHANEPTYGIAVVCGTDEYAMVTIVQATVAETTSQSFECSLAGESVGDVSGSVTGVSSGQGLSLHVAHHEIFTTAASYGGSMLPAGEWDVFALRRFLPFGQIVDTDRIIRRNAVTFTQSAPTVLDFDFATEGFDVESHTVSIQGEQPGDVTDVRTSLRNMPGGTRLELGPLTVGRYLALPRSALRGDDIHTVTVKASSADGSYRRVRRWLLAAQDFTAALPSLPPAPVIESTGSAPYLLIRGTVPSELDVDRYDFVYAQPTRADRYMTWMASLTRGYVATGATAYTLPDLTQLAAFDPSWGLLPSHDVDWQFVTNASDGGVAGLLDACASASDLDGRQDEVTQRNGRLR